MQFLHFIQKKLYSGMGLYKIIALTSCWTSFLSCIDDPYTLYIELILFLGVDETGNNVVQTEVYTG